MKIITRFAPSPSGNLHMGGARTAFYSWLFARKHQGKFILRIEDSDKNRCKPKYIDNIIKVLKWLNIDWDEGPIFQSSRYERYKIIIEHLLANNLAYKCYCSKERLIKLRACQISNRQKPKYDKYCFYYTPKNTKHSYVVRFNTPINGQIIFQDKIRGKISFNNKELDDVIICKSDGNYTYNFCSVVDDYDMGITHIIRGEDHINNTPRQIHILKALNVKNLPQYAHLSMLLDINKKKLSKRTKSLNILYFKKEGYLAESILHYLFILNNNKNENKNFSLDICKKNFKLNTNNKSSIIYDIKKLIWCNKNYIINLPNKLLINYFKNYLLNSFIDYDNKIDLKKIINLLKNRCNTLKNIYEDYIFFFKDINVNSCLLLIKKMNLIKFLIILPNLFLKFLFLKIWSKENINKIIKLIINKHYFFIENKLKDFYIFLNIIFTENFISPPILSIIEILGKEIILKRIQNVLLFNK